MITKTSLKDIDAYLATQPESTRSVLERLRHAIKKAAPGAEEVISYQMPAFKFHGMLVYFAGYKNHIGFYPAPSGIKAFEKELSAFKEAKGSVQFPLDKPLPLKLITKIVTFRAKENLEKAGIKKQQSLRICIKGHKYYKSSDCPACPICEQENKPKHGFLSLLAAPARRSLENRGITTLLQLSKFSEAEILDLHGMGKSSIPKLRVALESAGLRFATKK